MNDQTADSNDLPQTTRGEGRCGLQYCRLNPCRLISHWSYITRLMVDHSSSASEITNAVSMPQDPRILSTPDLVDGAVQHVHRFLETLPSVPSNQSIQKHSHQYRDLLHHYATGQMNLFSRVFAPHLNPQARTRAVLESAYAHPLVAICAIGNSQTARMMQSRTYTADRTAEVVYGLLLSILRQQLLVHKPADTPWVLMLVLVLSGLESCMNTTLDGLRAHRAAIQKLVTAAGGLHAVGYLRTLVLNQERFIALCLGEYPLYHEHEQSLRPVRPIGKYGRAFAELNGVVDLSVTEISEDQCRLIDVLETGHVDFCVQSEPFSASPMDPNILPYFLGLRDKVSADHARLHAYYHDNQVMPGDSSSIARAMSMSRCVLLAGHIVFYTVGFGDYFTIIRPMLGTELKQVLQQKPRSDWRAHESIVIWILFALATIPEWDAHEWAVVELRSWLSTKYAGHWPYGGWVVEEARKLRDFVWSDRTFSNVYHDVCKEVLELDRRLLTLPSQVSQTPGEAKSRRGTKSRSESGNNADDELEPPTP